MVCSPWSRTPRISRQRSYTQRPKSAPRWQSLPGIPLLLMFRCIIMLRSEGGGGANANNLQKGSFHLRPSSRPPHSPPASQTWLAETTPAMSRSSTSLPRTRPTGGNRNSVQATRSRSTTSRRPPTSRRPRGQSTITTSPATTLCASSH